MVLTIPVSNLHRNIIAIFADQDIGLKIVRYVLENHPEHLHSIITTGENEIAETARACGCRLLFYEEITKQNSKEIFEGVDIIFLAWWPRIIPPYLIDTPRIGVVNLHPSLLPYNRGKNYNFWTIVEETPFGVTLHFVDSGIDSGDILFQSRITKCWEDTGETLYKKAGKEAVSLFGKHYLDIISGRYTRIPQNLQQGQVHYFKELDPASRIDLDKTYVARDLLNLLRARTFEGKPSCFFHDEGKKYEVRISITEDSDEPD